MKNFIKKIGRVICISFIVTSIYTMTFYRAADKEMIKPLKNVEDYPIYDGREIYEYWKETLNDNQKIVYEEMKESYLQFKKYLSIHVDSITEEEFQEVYAAVLLDHPEIFWMNSYQIMVRPFTETVNVKKKIKLYYHYEEKEAQEVKKEIEPVYEEIITSAEKLDSDYKKILYVHDELIKLAAYKDKGSKERKKFQTLVSIFSTKESVCSGYTYGFKFIMDRLGIQSVSIRDIEEEDEEDNHIWNAVALNGKWYYIDVTWDDAKIDGEDVTIYNYFLKDYNVFYKDHVPQKNMPVNEKSSEE